MASEPPNSTLSLRVYVNVMTLESHGLSESHTAAALTEHHRGKDIAIIFRSQAIG